MTKYRKNWSVWRLLLVKLPRDLKTLHSTLILRMDHP
jgi:hypothetical protein